MHSPGSRRADSRLTLPLRGGTVFNRFPESNARRRRRPGGFVVSTVVHLALIALAVRATGLTAAPRPKPPTPSIVVFRSPPLAPTPPPRRAESDPSTAQGPSVP